MRLAMGGVGPRRITLKNRFAQIFRREGASSLRPKNLQVHHKIKRSQLGNDSLENLITLCAHCHMGEHGQLFYRLPAIRVCAKPAPHRG